MKKLILMAIFCIPLFGISQTEPVKQSNEKS